MKRILAPLALLAFAAPAFAGTDTANMNVSATVSDSCSISAGALTFGAYDTVSGLAVDGSAALTVACTSGSSAEITLGQGDNADTGSTDAAPLRRMSDGATSFLSYQLYQDAGHLTGWGNTSGTSVAYEASSAAPSTVSVYGSVDAGQDVPAGAYTDTVVATITF
jgi:spore coat protein U-like protein